MVEFSGWTIGVDLGDRKSHYFALNSLTGEMSEGELPMDPQGFRQKCRRLPRGRVILEVGAQSRWTKSALEKEGFEVMVVDARQLDLLTKSGKKTDRADAKLLAKLGAADTTLHLLNPVHHRSDEKQRDLMVTRSRRRLVEMRTGLINHIRGEVKTYGARLPTSDADQFHKLQGEVPAAISDILGVLFTQIESLTKQIRAFDRKIIKLCEDYPETKPLLEIHGVGHLTALVFVLTLDDPHRFKKSRDVGAYVGLVPRKFESGAIKKELGITKAGDHETRKLLVQCAHYILGGLGRDCDLKRWGLKLVSRGGRAAKKRAVVAVARKLAVLMHRIWVDQSVYEPDRHEKVTRAAAC